MLYIVIGIGLCYLAIRYGLAVPEERKPVLLGGPVGFVISCVMIFFGLALIAWGFF